MTRVSDYAQRVPYYRARYANNREEAIRRGRAYRAANKHVLKVARDFGISVPEAREMLRRRQ